MKKLTNSDFFNLCGDETIRLEQMIYLAGVLPSYDGGGMPAPLEDFFDNEVSDISTAFYNELPDYVLAAGMNEGDDETFNEACIDWMIQNKIQGFLVQVATPVMTHRDNSSSYSWGYYNTRWVYGDTLDDVAKHAVAWALEMRGYEKKTA